MGEIVFSSNCWFMSRSGLHPLSTLDSGCSILDVTGEFNRIEAIEPCDTDGLVALHVHDCMKYDCCSLDTPYLTYDKHTGEAAYVLARYLVAGMVFAVRETDDEIRQDSLLYGHARPCDRFGLRNHVTLGKTQYTMRAIHSIVKMDNQSKRCLSVKLKNTVTMQTANGIVKTWSV